MNITELQEILKIHNINLKAKEIAEIWKITETSFSIKKRDGSAIKPKYLKLLEEKFNITLIEECLENADFNSAGERIKFIRESMCMSQIDFAALLDVSRAFVSAVEKNKANLSVEKLAYLLKEHNVSANYILAGIGHPFLPTK